MPLSFGFYPGKLLGHFRTTKARLVFLFTWRSAPLRSLFPPQASHCRAVRISFGLVPPYPEGSTSKSNSTPELGTSRWIMAPRFRLTSASSTASLRRGKS